MSARALLARFARDARGVSAVEFAFIAPLMFMFYFATVEISMMLTIDRKVTNVASALGDLTAQDDLVDADEIDAIFAAARAIMDPTDSSAMEMRLTSVRMALDGDVEVGWSRARNMAPYGCSATVSVPAGLLSPGQSVIMAEVRFEYLSPVAEFLTHAYELSDTFYMRPRRSLEVEFNPDPC